MRNETKDKVRFGPHPIQTAEDARMAYLREEIDEDELEEILAKWGQKVEVTNLAGAQIINLDRVDAAFRRDLPETELPEPVSLDDRLKAVETKEKAREAARDAAPEDESDPNEKQREAGEKVFAAAAKKDDPPKQTTHEVKPSASNK